MNYTLQIHGERCLYQVPPGLYDLMSDISREVLRDQPDQLYKYIANYLDTLLKLKANMTSALEVVNDVLADNQELFAYVEARGLTWQEANMYARVMQRAWFKWRARKRLKERIRKDKEEKMSKQPFAQHSPSFIEYFESLGIDYETANRASLTIQSAFNTYKARKEMKLLQKGSTHTIDMVAPSVEVPLVLQKPTARDSKLLIYQQSPVPSIASGWYKPIEEVKKKSVRTSTTSGRLRSSIKSTKEQIYEQTPRPSVASMWHAIQRKGTDVSVEARRLGLYPSFLEREPSNAKPSPLPTMESTVPAYFDAYQSKVPMITESGKLEVLEEDVVTLFSTDTLRVSKSIVESASSLSHKERDDKLPNLKDLGKLSSKTESETGKELFGMIQKKSSEPDVIPEALLKANAGRGSLLLAEPLNKSEVDKDTPARPSDSESSHQRTGSRPRTSSRMLKLLVKRSSDELEEPPPES